MYSSRRFSHATPRLALLLYIALMLVVAITSGSNAKAATTCTKYASLSGSDSSSGTSSAPFATAQKLVSSLTSGQTGCLMGGAFTENVTFSAGGSSESTRVTLMTAPGYSQATISGYIYQPPTTNYITLDNLHVVARCETCGNLVQLFGDYGRITNSNVDGNNLNVAGGVSLGYQRRVVGSEVDHNRIHNFGRDRSIYHHGIYASYSDGARIHDNYIYDNIGGYGMTMWTSVWGSKVYNNTFDGNGAGNIQIAGQKDAKGGPSSNNEFYRNILSNPQSGNNTNIFWGSFSSDQTNAGTGNTVHDNVYWNGALDPGSAYGAKVGVTYANNVNVDPQYLNRSTKDFTLGSGSPAAGYGVDASSSPAAGPASTALPTISGSPIVGQVLTASTGSWSGSPTAYAYAWLRCGADGGTCAAIAGATASSYTAATADAGSTLRVAVTASSTAGQATATSAATAVVTSPTAASSIAEGATLSGMVHWAATASADTKSVEFWADGVRLATETAAPYALDLDTTKYADGAHIVGIAWTDGSGVRHPASPATNVKVSNVVAPTSSIREGAVLSSVTHWTATVSSGTKSIEFWIDNKCLQTLTAGPYAYDLNTRKYANGQHVVGIAWTDSAGVRHAASPATNVTIKN